MRDEFPQRVKEELAKRVGYLCSNPACRQPTSGPKAAPTGTVNIGVAAHVTSAAKGGPRYNASLSPEERSGLGNGIWLCQTCAKLVDSDEEWYPEEKIFEWRTDAETAAATALERRKSPTSHSQGVFLEVERLMPDLISEMREDVQEDRTELVREFALLSSSGVSYTTPKTIFRYHEDEHPELLSKVDWMEEMGLVVDVTSTNVPKYRMLPEFVDWLRGST